jgi:hypothetical protein
VSARASSTSSLFVGLIVAAATTGALVAIGHRLGSVGLPFAAIAAPLLRRTVTSSDPGLIVMGVGFHILLMFCWSALYASMVNGRGWSLRKLLVGAGVVATLSYGVSWIVARTTGNGLASVLPLGDRIVLGAVLAFALTLGIGFAFSARRETATYD